MYTMIPNSKEQKFKKTNLDILQMDITPLLLNKMPYIGFIGKNKKRLDIRFSSIQKIKRGGYIAKGNSLVSNNKRDFEGVISIDTIFYFSKLCYGLEDEYKGDVKAQGIIVANYKFKEDDKLTATGTFEGKLLIRWYINSKNILLYDDIESYSDPYFNNAFIGTWTSYKTGKTQQCNWGQRRIPCSGD
ncbi:hypothetical protein, partial [Capnocytophaga catalasegens]|uniref:hypothetical protein n=1 Tax=Capnocytophaga catalasegens TaxID=1004260 RepID=UPI002230839B